MPGALLGLGLCACLLAGTGCGDDYPPPLLAGTAPPTVRVLLGHPRARATLHVPGPTWEVSSQGGRAFAVRDRQDLRTALGCGTTGILFRGRDTGATVLRIRPARTFTLDRRTYAGTLIVRRKGSRLEFVNELDLETYVAGVLANEVGPKAAPATYRAQSVTARTYAFLRLTRANAASAPYHLFDDARSQVYSGMTPAYGVPYADMVQRTAETRGVVLTWRGRPFRAYYASTCGGHTTDAATSQLDPGHAAGALHGVPCHYCKTSKYYRWSRTVSDAELVAGAKRARRPLALPIHAVRIARRGRGGWVAQVDITCGPRKNVRSFPGTVFRTVARLRSHNISAIRRRAGGWRVDGRGWGHGVGMCQWGAIEMGSKGASETEILRYYYPGVAFTKVY